MKSFFKVAIAGLMLTTLTACGQLVEVESAHLGKVLTKDGYLEEVIPQRRFRLDPCWAPGSVCQRLVVVDVSDRSSVEPLRELFMPEDRLQMDFEVGVTYTVDRTQVDQLFEMMPISEERGSTSRISIENTYDTYVRRIVRTEARNFLTQFKIDDIASNLNTINAQLSSHIREAVESQTPITIRYVGLDSIDYPEVIVKAQQRSAERNEDIRQEQAQLEVSRVRLERELEEERLQRLVDIERAEAAAEVHRILGDSMSDNYRDYRQLEVLEKLSTSDNKTFIPVEMLGSMATQVMLGNQ